MKLLTILMSRFSIHSTASPQGSFISFKVPLNAQGVSTRGLCGKSSVIHSRSHVQRLSVVSICTSDAYIFYDLFVGGLTSPIYSPRQIKMTLFDGWICHYNVFPSGYILIPFSVQIHVLMYLLFLQFSVGIYRTYTTVSH